MTEDVVQNNLGLVHACAKKFVGRGIEYEDIFQAGCLGLTKASKKFDETRGLKFSTYAVPVILGEIKSLFRYGTAIKISRGIKELSVKVARENEKFQKDKGYFPTVSQLAEILDTTPEKIAQSINASYKPTSLTSDEDEKPVPVASHEEKLTESMALWQTIETLKDEEKKIISLRYYMNKTQKETAELLGSSQVQISRKEKKILLYMRGALV